MSQFDMEKKEHNTIINTRPKPDTTKTEPTKPKSCYPSFLTMQRSKHHDTDVFCGVVRNLIRWRLLTFYAPFIKGFESESDSVSVSLDVGANISGPRTRPQVIDGCNLLDNQNGYAASKARAHANGLLEGIREVMDFSDLLEIHRLYVLQKQRYEMKGQVSGCKLTPGRRAFDTVVATAHRLRVPLSQVEVALNTFFYYNMLLHENCRRVSPPRPIQSRLTACYMAGQNRWSELANTASMDIKFVTAKTHFLVDASLAHYADPAAYRKAVQRCVKTYFISLRHDWRPCTCRFHPACASSSHLLHHTQLLQNDDADNELELSSSLCGLPALSLIDKRLSRRAAGVRTGCRCKCNTTVTYKLQKQENHLSEHSPDRTVSNGLELSGSAVTDWANARDGALCLEKLHQ